MAYNVVQENNCFRVQIKSCEKAELKEHVLFRKFIMPFCEH